MPTGFIQEPFPEPDLFPRHLGIFRLGREVNHEHIRKGENKDEAGNYSLYAD